MRFNCSFPKYKPFEVVGMGLNSVDFVCAVPEFPVQNSKMRILKFSKQGGGQVATAMVALSCWGVRTKYIGKIGGDELGQFSLTSLREEGVDISSVTIEPNATNQYAMILVDGPSGERTILWDRDERLMYREGELRKKDICSGKILHLDGHDIRAALQCARWAKEEKALIELQKHTPGFLCATLGHEGAVTFVNGELVYVKGFEVRAVDTTGAGDVFHAGFIYGLLENWEIEEILRFTNAVAALKCQELGGREGIPTLEEVQKFLGSS
jgi:sulfofructose kinase